ncbi:MAG: alginate O-acetyltransferase complex protein AlgI [Kiritimatiellia bacterium]|jgi:alginate O-acetyltransferase complex protein AlgI
MLFHSATFIFYFLPFTVAIFFLCQRFGHPVASRAALLTCSLFFYSWWNIIYLPLILGSMVFNFFVGGWLCRQTDQKKKKPIFIVGVVVNLLVLGTFKYLDFFIENVNVVFDSDIALLKIILPLGISFFTLQQVAFLVDAYENLAEEHHFIDYGLFVSFFPQLIAGPIVHHAEMMPQFVRAQPFQSKHLMQGLVLFIIGLSKKLLIADPLADWVNPLYSAAPTFFEAWAGMYAYTFQLYFDFSGYVDMGLGAALVLNIHLPINFKSPLQTTTIVAFWNHWHMTLSNFIMSYIYTPILRSYRKVTFNKAMLASMIAMFISGLWHGASWNFILFGAMHGVAICVNQIRKKKKARHLPKAIAWLLTFHFVTLSLVVARSKNMVELKDYLNGLIGRNGIILPEFMEGLSLPMFSVRFGELLPRLGGDLWTPVFLAFCLILALRCKTTQDIAKEFKPRPINALVFGALFAICLLRLDNPSEFIYFQF